MWRFLVVGDPHATVEELPDCHKLLDFIIKTMREHAVTDVVFLGDQYHTHAIMHVEVLAFWRHAFQLIHDHCGGAVIHLMLGNHDMPGNDASTAHALLAHIDTGYVRVYDKPQVNSRLQVSFVPYMSDPDRFVAACNELPHDLPLFCHQTFAGVLNDNGFLAKDGVDSNLLPQKEIVSGHIHKPQTVGKVWYPGAPRWRTLSDANVDRAIWLIDTEHGRVENKMPFRTNGVCRTIRHFKITPETAHLLVLGEVANDDLRIDIEGPADFVAAQQQRYLGHARIRTHITDTVKVRVKESDGIPVALKKYSATYKARHGTPPDALERKAMERLGWA